MENLSSFVKDGIFWKALLVVLSVFLFIFLYVKEFHHINLMINARMLIVPAVITFAAFGLILGGWLQRKLKDPTDRLRIFMACLIIAVVIAPFFISFTNRALSYKPIRYESVIFNSVQPFFASRLGRMKGESLEPTGFYLYFYYQERLIRVTLKQSLAAFPPAGESMLIPVKQGFWGTNFIAPDKFEEVAF